MPESNETPGSQEAPATGADGKPVEQPSAEDLAKKVEELTAASRKWEERAKENFEARKERDELKKAAMTAEERKAAEAVEAEAAQKEILKRAEKAEQRADAAEAALVRYKIATEFSLTKEDAEALEKVQADEATLRALAERFATQAGPRPRPRSQGAGDGKPTSGTSTKDQFAEALEGLF